ncbi:MAG: hypothetical protein K2M79_02830, partial [Muribaculaceae bacterium]|nr:hypothetical protein [Muribaculaceae bacterium]
LTLTPLVGCDDDKNSINLENEYYKDIYKENLENLNNSLKKADSPILHLIRIAHDLHTSDDYNDKATCEFTITDFQQTIRHELECTDIDSINSRKDDTLIKVYNTFKTPDGFHELLDWTRYYINTSGGWEIICTTLPERLS